jgi:starvation-inducible DNA-binding protein
LPKSEDVGNKKNEEELHWERKIRKNQLLLYIQQTNYSSVEIISHALYEKLMVWNLTYINKTSKHMKPDIGITEKNLQAISGILTGALADTTLLYLKTRKFHWNVKGESFMELHKLFESQYNKLEEAIDEIAERINKLGMPVIGTCREYLQHGTIKEAPGKYPDKNTMLKELLGDHETIIKALRKGIEACDEKYKDAGTADFLTGLLQEHETIAWTLRRYFN